MNVLRGNRFRTTRWCLVINAAGDTPEAGTALSELCELYWGPVYAFVRRSGHSVEDARDLTQAFFARVLEKGAFHAARPDRGRFRSYLLGCLRHFLSNSRDATQAIKRGGTYRHVSLEYDSVEHQERVEVADRLTPERIYERQWTTTVLAAAMALVERQYEEAGRGRLFGRIKGALTGDEAVSYTALASDLDTTEGALRVAVHRLRKEFGAALRATIAETVGDPADVDDELRYLLDIVGRTSGG